jgi:2-polyprenyl-3-methyl-5-hydroxy-6-metoxy-1,4-benzoquinol methylase
VRRDRNTGSNEYSVCGAYHAELRMPPTWLPRYFRRLHIVQEVLSAHLPEEASIIDVGGGEGALVEGLVELGFKNIVGVDPYAPFSNGRMVKGDILALPFHGAAFDAVICLDVLEHVPLHLQLNAARSLERLLKPGGFALVSVPNMAHLKSRIDFLFKGQPWRNKLRKHPGELTMLERLQVLREAGLLLADSVGLHLTLSYNPTPKGPLGRLISSIMFSVAMPPALCWTVVLLVYKKPRPQWIGNIPARSRKWSPLRAALKSYAPPKEDPTSFLT